jgi:hypothetical protein
MNHPERIIKVIHVEIIHHNVAVVVVVVASTVVKRVINHLNVLNPRVHNEMVEIDPVGYFSCIF